MWGAQAEVPVHACRRLAARLVDAAIYVAAFISAGAQVARDNARPLVALPLQAPASAVSWVKAVLLTPGGADHASLEE